MTEPDELSFVAIDGRTLPHSHAELVYTRRGWHVELDDVPLRSCPSPQQVSEITLQSLKGDRYEGRVIADLVTEGGAYVLLSGIGELRLIATADAP